MVIYWGMVVALIGGIRMKIYTNKQIRKILKKFKYRIDNEPMTKDYARTESLRLYADIKLIFLKRDQNER